MRKASARCRGVYILELICVVTVMLPFLLMCMGLFDYYRKAHQLSALVERFAGENTTKLLRLRTGDQVYTVSVRADDEGGCGGTDSFADSLTSVAQRYLKEFNELELCDHAAGCGPQDVGLSVQVYSPLVSEIDGSQREFERIPQEHDPKNPPPGRCLETSDNIKLGYLLRAFGNLEKSLRPDMKVFFNKHARTFVNPTAVYGATSRQAYGVTTMVDGAISILTPDSSKLPPTRNYVRHAPVFVFGATVDISKTFAGKTMCSLAAGGNQYSTLDCWGDNPPQRRLTNISVGAPRKVF